MALSALPCPYGTVVDLDHRNNNNSRRRNSSINNNSNNMPPFILINSPAATARLRPPPPHPAAQTEGKGPRAPAYGPPPLPANDACAGEEKGAHAPDTQDGLVRSLTGIIGCLTDCIIAATTKKPPAKKTVHIGGSKSQGHACPA